MPRLIDADALEKRHCENCGEIARKICKDDPVCATLMWVREEPTIDPESLRPHGRWEEWWPPNHYILTGEEMLFRCSACDAKYADKENMKYCPNCGATMDLEEEMTIDQD